MGRAKAINSAGRSPKTQKRDNFYKLVDLKKSLVKNL